MTRREVSVQIRPDHGGDVPWVDFKSRDRSMQATLRFNVALRQADFTINVAPSPDETVLLYSIPAWTTRSQLNKLVADERFVAALDAIRMEVPVSDAPAVFDALDDLPAMVATLKDLPQVGDVLLVPERPEPILTLGYTGSVRIKEISPYNAMAWVEKLDARKAGDDFEIALIGLSDLRLPKVKKIPALPRAKAAKPLLLPDASVREPVTASLF